MLDKMNKTSKVQSESRSLSPGSTRMDYLRKAHRTRNTHTSKILRPRQTSRKSKQVDDWSRKSTPRHSQTTCISSFRITSYNNSIPLPHDIRHFSEYEPRDSSERPRAVGVNADKQVHECAHYEEHQEQDGEDLHLCLFRIIYN